MGTEQEDKPTLKEHHQKFSDTAKVVMIMIGATILLEAVDITSTWLLRRSASVDLQAIRDTVSSVSAESRLTAERLDHFIQDSKKRWTFLRDDNEGKINVPALTPEEVDLERASKARRPSPTPTPSVHHHSKPRPVPTAAPRKKYFWE